MAEILSDKVLTRLEETYDTYEAEANRGRVRRGKRVSRAQSRYWRRVPSVSVLPYEKVQLPSNLLLRGGLIVAIVLLVLLTGARYLDWRDSEVRAEATDIRSDSVKRQLTARQNEIEPLQSQIRLLNSDNKSAETSYSLVTEGRADWFTAIDRLFSISVSGVDFLSAEIDSDGEVSLVGVATSPDAIALLPNQLSQLAGVVNLQGIQWDAEVSPPEFTAEFQVIR